MARILITGFCSYPGPDRLGVQLPHVIEGLQRNHQVDVLCVRSNDQSHNERVGSNRILRVALPEGSHAEQVEAFSRALRRQLEGTDYDVVHFRDAWTGVTALKMQRQHKYATVFDVARSPMAEPVLIDLATAKELEMAQLVCLKHANMVLAPTEAARQHLAGLCDAAKVFVVPPGVNVDLFDWEPPRLDARPVILYLGSLTPGCGLRVLLRALFDVAHESDAVLVLAGRTSQTFAESVQRTVLDMDLGGRVRLLGEVPNRSAPAVIARATVCVAASAAELEAMPTALYPTKILEYMACQRAVVAPRRSSVQTLLRDGQHGLLFEPGSPQDLARKILRLLKDVPLRGRIAQAGYQLVRSTYSAGATRRALRLAYDWLSHQEAFPRAEHQDAQTGSITDLGLDVGQRPMQHDMEDQSYDEDTIMLDDLSEAGGEGGEVTQVEVFPLPEDPKTTQGPAQQASNGQEIETAEQVALEAPKEIQEEYTDEWVIDEDGVPKELRDEALTGPSPLTTRSSSETVVTAPLDQSVVTGELRSRNLEPQQEQTRIATSPLAALDQESGRLATQSDDGKTTIMRQEDVRPQPRAPRLPLDKTPADKAGAKKKPAPAASSPSDNKRS